MRHPIVERLPAVVTGAARTYGRSMPRTTEPRSRDRWLLRAADLVRLSLVAGAVTALAMGQPVQAFRFVIVLLVTLGARWLRVPRPFGLALTVALAVETWGRLLGLYLAGDRLDEDIHWVWLGCL